jgi:hypothetical protein
MLWLRVTVGYTHTHMAKWDDLIGAIHWDVFGVHIFYSGCSGIPQWDSQNLQMYNTFIGAYNDNYYVMGLKGVEMTCNNSGWKIFIGYPLTPS